MRICYLPIFLAIATAAVPQHLPLSRMIYRPTDGISGLSKSMADIFSGRPLGFSATGSFLSPSKGYGRKRRASLSTDGSRQSSRETPPDVRSQYNTPVSSIGLVKTKSLTANGVVDYSEHKNPFKNAPSFTGSLPRKMFIRSTNARKLDLKTSAGAGEVQAKAMETGMKGTEVMQKGVESGQMVANAGSDLAQSGKAGAEGLASGAEMMSGAAETISAGAGQLQGMAGGLSG